MTWRFRSQHGSTVFLHIAGQHGVLRSPTPQILLIFSPLKLATLADLYGTRAILIYSPENIAISGNLTTAYSVHVSVHSYIPVDQTSYYLAYMYSCCSNFKPEQYCPHIILLGYYILHVGLVLAKKKKRSGPTLVDAVTASILWHAPQVPCI